MEMIGLITQEATRPHKNPNGTTVTIPSCATVGINVVIHPDASLGKKNKIGDNSAIGINTIIGDNVVIGSDCRLVNCIIGDRVEIGNFVLAIKPGIVISDDKIIPNESVLGDINTELSSVKNARCLMPKCW